MVQFGRAVLAAAVALSVLVTGCTRAGGCPEGKTCLRYMAWGNPEQLAVEREIIAQFNAENPDLYVKLFNVPGSAYRQKMVMMLASRTAPDILRVDHYVFPHLQGQGYFIDLTDFVESDPTYRLEDYFETGVEEGSVNGRVYGLNVLFGGILIYYNKTLFAEAGLPDPYELYLRGEWTWDQFFDAAKAITKFDASGRPLQFGTAIPYFPANVTAVWGFGGDLLAEDQKTAVVDHPGTIRAYQFWSDLVWEHQVAPTPAQGANSAFVFESGKLGMWFDFMGMTPRYRNVIHDFEWDVCPIPAGPYGRTTVIKGNQLVMAQNTRHPEAAWRFMRFLTGKEAETRLYAELRRCFPTRKDVAYSPTYLETDLPPFQMDVFVRSVEGGRTLPVNERWSEWTQVFTSELDNLFAGRERDAGVVMRRAKERIDRVLAEDPGF